MTKRKPGARRGRPATIGSRQWPILYCRLPPEVMQALRDTATLTESTIGQTVADSIESHCRGLLDAVKRFQSIKPPG